MGYVAPCAAPISSTWAQHKARTPPSGEPGTDYACAYGTPIACAGAGVVVDLSWSTAGGTGRYLTINLDDGRRVRYLHLSSLLRAVGDRVGPGDHVALSGASGFGLEWGYGAHVHVTLFPAWAYDFAGTLDFELYVSDQEEEDMTPEQAESLNECRRMLGVMLGWQGAVNDSEGRQVERLWGEGETTSESRRMLGVMMGWNEPASENERQALARLWETPPARRTPRGWALGVFLGIIAVVDVIRLVLDVLT